MRQKMDKQKSPAPQEIDRVKATLNSPREKIKVKKKKANSASENNSPKDTLLNSSVEGLGDIAVSFSAIGSVVMAAASISLLLLATDDIKLSISKESAESISRLGQERQILKQKTIVNQFYKEKRSKVFSVIKLTGLAFLLLQGAIVFRLVPEGYNNLPFYSLIPLFIVWLQTAILRFRILKGYYGNNPSEAKELIAFIEQISDDMSPPSGGDEIKTFPEGVVNSQVNTTEDLSGEMA
jgi:hypothetical protein